LVKKVEDLEKFNKNLLQAVIAEDYSLISQAITQGAQLELLHNIRFSYRFMHEVELKAPLIILAVILNSLELLEVLFSSGADINAVDSQGNNALMVAIQLEHRDMVKKLLSYSPALEITNNFHESVMDIAAAKNDGELMHMLLAKASSADSAASLISTDLSECAKSDSSLLRVDSALHLSAAHAVRVMPDEPIDKQDRIGQTALIRAVIARDYDKVQTLVKGGANVLIKDNYGKTAFKYAAAKNDKRLIKLLDTALSKPTVSYSASALAIATSVVAAGAGDSHLSRHTPGLS